MSNSPSETRRPNVLERLTAVETWKTGATKQLADHEGRLSVVETRDAEEKGRDEENRRHASGQMVWVLVVVTLVSNVVTGLLVHYFTGGR